MQYTSSRIRPDGPKKQTKKQTKNKQTKKPKNNNKPTNKNLAVFTCVDIVSRVMWRLIVYLLYHNSQ